MFLTRDHTTRRARLIVQRAAKNRRYFSSRLCYYGSPSQHLY